MFDMFPFNMLPDAQAIEEQRRCFLAQREALKVAKKEQRDLREMHEQETYRRELMDRREGESIQQQMQRQVHATTLLFEYQERVEERRRQRDRQEAFEVQKKEEVVQRQIARRQKQLLEIEKDKQERKREFESKCRVRQDARDLYMAQRLAQEQESLESTIGSRATTTSRMAEAVRLNITQINIVRWMPISIVVLFSCMLLYVCNRDSASQIRRHRLVDLF